MGIGLCQRILNLSLEIMGLSAEQVRNLLKDKPRATELDRARKHESRLTFHCETILNKAELPQAYYDHLAWVGGTTDSQSVHSRLLPDAKFKRYKQLLSTPIETVELTEAMFTKLNRVFTAEDAHREYGFNKEGLDEDFVEFYDGHSFWKNAAQAIQTDINAVWVADLPEVQVGEFPEPYGYLVNINQVKDIYNDSDGNCQWLMFVSGDYLFVYDDTSIRKFEYEDGKLGGIVGEFAHGLGYTPARQVWSDKLSVDDNVNKKSPVTNVLTSLDNYLFMSVNKKYMDLGNSYPITAAYESGSGVPQDNNQNTRSDDTKSPAGSDLMGPGTFIELPAPLPGEVDLMSNPVQIIAPDVKSLEYHSDMLEKAKERIFENVVGREDDRNNDQAKNEAQVQSAVESREEVLMKYKRNWEIIEKFSAETLARLRYGDIEEVSIDYGSEFFLQSLSGLQTDYKLAAEAGADPVILQDIKDAIVNLKYRNNPSGKMRANLITDLTPLRDKSVKEMIDLYKEGLVAEVDLKIRVNLLDLVARFEREEAPLNVFGKKLDYSKKLEKIREILESYVKTEVETPPESEINKGEND